MHTPYQGKTIMKPVSLKPSLIVKFQKETDKGSLTCNTPCQPNKTIIERPLEFPHFQRSLQLWRKCKQFVIDRTWNPENRRKCDKQYYLELLLRKIKCSISIFAYFSLCVCVRERERDRERESMKAYNDAIITLSSLYVEFILQHKACRGHWISKAEKNLEDQST